MKAKSFVKATDRYAKIGSVFFPRDKAIEGGYERCRFAMTIKQQAFSTPNIRLFLWFRVLFNCRFYYPVLAIFFVDLGLSLSQYIFLNVIWAVTIVLLEVPSGALADIVGRKVLVVFSSLIMVLEMCLLVFAPANGGWFLFSICALNRVLAGVAEAAASGADEALAYDSLEGEKRSEQWDEVLSSLGRRMSIGMAVAVALGALLYDARTFAWMHMHLGIPQLPAVWIIKIPVFLCMVQGLVALMIALRIKDVETSQSETKRVPLSQIFGQTLKAVRWVWTTKMAFVLLLGGMIIDAVTRNFATLTSSYYRHIELPEFSFGFIGAGIALCGFVVPYYAKPLAQKFGVIGNIFIVSCISLVGLLGLALFKNVWGIVPAILVMLSLKQVGFVSSRFLNQLTTPEIRATVLSVKGLLFNLSYAFFSILFAQSVTWRSEMKSDKESFSEILLGTPIFTLICMCFFFIYALFVVRDRANTQD